MNNPHTQQTQSRKWLGGLDIMRGFGALTVVTAHALLPTPYDLPIANIGVTWRIVYLGNILLEVFFAMSGFLIGGELLKDMTKKPSWGIVGTYWVRRWTRTLPAYYLILLIVTAWEAFNTGLWHMRWGHVFFVQNFTDQIFFLGVAWTLVVEQWGYALLPVLIFCLQRLLPLTYSPLHRVMLSAAIIIGIMLLVRGLTLYFYPHVIMDEGIRKQPHLRLDALMYGLLIACCKDVYPRIYLKLQSVLCVILVVAAIFMLIEIQYNDHFIRNTPHEVRRFFHATLGFTIMGVLAALLLPFLEREILPDILSRYAPRTSAVLRAIALTSYSLYLIHLVIIDEFSKFFHKMRSSSVLWDSLFYTVGMVGAILVSVWLAHVFFTFVEKPGMASRKWFIRGALG